MSRKYVIASLFVVGAIALGVAARSHRRARNANYVAPENSGDHAGPLLRRPPHYNPSKKPSRPWLDYERTAPAPTTYHAYAASAIGGRMTDYLLYLPPGYGDAANAARRYPVVYWLHGYASAPQWGMPFVEGLDAAIRAGRVPPIIAVLPNGLHDSWYADSEDGSQPMESVIVRDLIPHVDSTWRTIADQRSRAIEGFSMGAWGAAHLGLKHPDLFCAVTLVSAPMHTHASFPQYERIFSGSPTAFYAEDPVTIAKRDAATLKDALRVRVLIGDKDAHLHFAHHFDAKLAEWQIPHALTVVPGVGHDDDGVYRSLGFSAFAFYADLFK